MKLERGRREGIRKRVKEKEGGRHRRGVYIYTQKRREERNEGGRGRGREGGREGGREESDKVGGG